MATSGLCRQKLGVALADIGVANEICDEIDGITGQSAANALTAVGTTQGGALNLTAKMNRVTTAAATTAPFNGVRLFAALAGDEILVTNNAANPIQVYGAGSDTINAVATATGVTQPPNSVVRYSCTVNGLWQTEDLGEGYSGSLPTNSALNAITAFSTGGQASATALPAVINRITVCAAAGDSVLLPPSAAGLFITVRNDGAQSANVFPSTGDAINSQAANTSFPIPAGLTGNFWCSVAGTWHTLGPTTRVFSSGGASAPVAAQAETIFATNAFTILANTLKPGMVLKMRGQGTVATANGTLQIRVRYGGVAGVLLLDTGNAITPSNGDIFTFDLRMAVIDVGGTGHIYGTYMWSIGTAGTGTMRGGKTASSAIDTTADKVVNVTQQNGTGAGSITLDYLDAEIN